MEIQRFTIKDSQGKDIVIENKRFTDEELAKMPEKHRNAILNFRKIFVDSYQSR